MVFLAGHAAGPGVPQVVPAEVINPGPCQCLVPSMIVSLGDWFAFISKNTTQVFTYLLPEHLYRFHI